MVSAGGDMRDAFIIVIEHSDKLSDVFDALPFDDAEFRKLASKGVRNGRPLVDEQLPGYMLRQRRLLWDCRKSCARGRVSIRF
jgi:hypothetical protein